MKRNKQFQGSKHEGREAARQQRHEQKAKEQQAKEVMEKAYADGNIEGLANALGIRLT